MKDENEDSISRNFLKQRIKNVKNILIKENEMPKIDQIFKYELKLNLTEINDLLHYVNGIIYKNVDTFQKLILLYSYDDNNDYNTSNVKQNTFLYLLKQKIKFREKYKKENYVDYLKTNPLIFIDTLNNLLIIPGISFEFKVYNFDEKVNKFFITKSDIKSNTMYNPCFIKLRNAHFKNIIKISRRADKSSRNSDKKSDQKSEQQNDKQSGNHGSQPNERQNEQHIESYFEKRNTLSNSKMLNTNFVSEQDLNSKNEQRIHHDKHGSEEAKCELKITHIDNHLDEKRNGEISREMELTGNVNCKNDKNFAHPHVASDVAMEKGDKRKRKKRNTVNTTRILESNNSTHYKKKHKTTNTSNGVDKENSETVFLNGLKEKAQDTNGSECADDVEDIAVTAEDEGMEKEEKEREEEYEFESSRNDDSSSNKGAHFFYNLVNQYEVYINNVKCYIVFDLKSCYKNLDIMIKLKKNLEELKKPNNVFKEIINKKTFKSSRDKIEFIKRFKKMIIPNFRIEKIRKQRNHLIIIELMSKVQNSLIIKRLYQELTDKVNLHDLIKNALEFFTKSVENIKNEHVKNFYLSMIKTYFQNSDLSAIDFKNLVQLFKKKEEHLKNEEFYNLFQNDLNYLEKNKKQCDEIEEKINSLKYLISESILKEKQLERSVNRLLLNHEQSKYGYFYKVDQSDDNTLDTTEYGKLLENFSKEPINFYTILNKRNLDKHAYHDIRNFNYKKKDNDEEALKNDATTSSHNQVNRSIATSCENCKLDAEGEEENQTEIGSKKEKHHSPSANDQNGDRDSSGNAHKLSENQCASLKEKIEGEISKSNNCNMPKQDTQNGEKEPPHNCNNQGDHYKCRIKKTNGNDKNQEKKDQYDKKMNSSHIVETKNTRSSGTTVNNGKRNEACKEQNCRNKEKDSGKNCTYRSTKEARLKKSSTCQNKKQAYSKDKYKNPEEEMPSEYETECERDIIRSTCERRNFTFANERQEEINNEIFYKVFEQYPYSFFSKSVKNYNLILNENKEESELSWLTMLKRKTPNKSILPPSRDTFRDGTHFSNCRATEHTLKFFLSLLSLLTKSDIDINLKQYLKKNIQFLNTELFSMKLNLDKRRAILEKRLDHFNFQENSEFSFYNPLKMNIRMMNLIGRGGFAEVWEVFDSINLEMYAAKIHKIEPSMTNEIKNKIIQRAENEINIHIHCHRHIFIVKLEFFFVFGSATNLLVGMELCDIDLDKYIKSHGPINELLALCWVKQILLGLLYMKTLPTGKVHHCDLKPANLLIKDGIIKISDFGLAKLILPDTYQYYNGGGTLYYQPPECLRNKKSLPITDKIDIWSLGCILYEMLFCERPFQFNYLEKCSKELLVNKMKRGLSYPKINQQISEVTLNYIQYLLNFDYEFRPSIEEALAYPIFNFFRIP
ncbi:TLK protein kinase [Plasmodium inui San Antonio 1]|uniref:TLK protein kinase n=1 Tax=Plasmodium inui San Antonio 1 TaxID=1237626 RepID=W7A270_9APIC|nr:TLK protein kinase [Plasmodium inui San Antonio 1]EUD67322.1 TLK protein kinase [Plasmodium inui San Antonio 1]